jgi:hypothetical protein
VNSWNCVCVCWVGGGNAITNMLGAGQQARPHTPYTHRRACCSAHFPSGCLFMAVCQDTPPTHTGLSPPSPACHVLGCSLLTGHHIAQGLPPHHCCLHNRRLVITAQLPVHMQPAAVSTATDVHLGPHLLGLSTHNSSGSSSSRGATVNAGQVGALARAGRRAGSGVSCSLLATEGAPRYRCQSCRRSIAVTAAPISEL